MAPHSSLCFRIKTLYRECREKLTATGAGLVDEGREDEFEPDSQLANIWGKLHSVTVCKLNTSLSLDEIQKDFPWYKRMNALMRGHPLVDRSGVANSTTDMDLNILDRSCKVS